MLCDISPFRCMHFRHLASSWATDFDKWHWIAMFPSLPHHLSDDTLYISTLPSPLLHPPVFRNRRLHREELWRTRKSSIRVCLPAIPIKGSTVLAICELRRPRARSCAFPRNWTGSILRGHPRISLPLFLWLHRASYVHTYIHIYITRPGIGRTTHWDRKILFPLDVRPCLRNVRGSKVNFLLSFYIYHCSSMYSEIRPYFNVTVILYVTCLDHSTNVLVSEDMIFFFYEVRLDIFVRNSKTFLVWHL